VEALLLETALAQAVDERTAPRRALQAALTAPEPLDALRPFIHAEPGRSGFTSAGLLAVRRRF
jgi:LuxR family maltose regulon positive regulatory protein